MKVKVIDLAKLNLLKYRSYAAVSIIVAISLLIGFYFKTNRDYVDAEAASAKEQIIILDAGHGGEDPGATSASGKHEKDLNLEIALCLGEMLTEKGYTTQLIWVKGSEPGSEVAANGWAPHYWLIVKLDGQWKHLDATPGPTHTVYDEPMNDTMRQESLKGNGRTWDRDQWPACP